MSTQANYDIQKLYKGAKYVLSNGCRKSTITHNITVREESEECKRNSYFLQKGHADKVQKCVTCLFSEPEKES